MRFFFLPILCFTFLFSLNAQKKNANYQYHIRKASSNIKIDGVIDEQAWQDAAVANDFFMVLPMDTSRSSVKTA